MTPTDSGIDYSAHLNDDIKSVRSVAGGMQERDEISFLVTVHSAQSDDGSTVAHAARNISCTVYIYIYMHDCV